MNNSQVIRAIQSIGKGCFVKYFEKFHDDLQKNEDLVELLMRNEKYTETASRTRVTNSRNLIKSGHAREVLSDITQSKRLDSSIKFKAKQLLEKYYA